MRIVVLQFLENVGLYEHQEEAVRREEVLGRLDQVTTLLIVFCMFVLFF